MTHVACKSKQRLVVRSPMHPFPGIWVAIGYAFVYYVRAVHAFSAGTKCWHCRRVTCGEIYLFFKLFVYVTICETIR